MNGKQKRFALEYTIDLNGAQAAIRAGYSPATAKEQASRLLTNVNVQNEIAVIASEQAKQTGITAERVLKEFAKIAFSDIRKYYNEDGTLKKPAELDNDAAAALTAIDVLEEYEMKNGKRVQVGTTKKLRLYDKLKALEGLGRHLSIFNDSIKINFDLMSNDELDKLLLLIVKKHTDNGSAES